jgi:hypothetical protein
VPIDAETYMPLFQETSRALPSAHNFSSIPQNRCYKSEMVMPLTSYPLRTVTIQPNDRLFDTIIHLLTLTACVSVATNAVGLQRYVEVPESIFPSRHFDVAIHIPTLGPIESALADQRPSRIEIFLKKSPTLPSQSSGSSEALFPLLGFVASIVFVNFYEANLSWLQTNFTKEAKNWPTLFAFCRVIRNFIAHRGCVDFYPNAKPASWRHISYSPSDQGRRVIGTEFQYPEILLLMIEMSEELDRLKAPLV